MLCKSLTSQAQAWNRLSQVQALTHSIPSFQNKDKQFQARLSICLIIVELYYKVTHNYCFRPV